MQRPRRITLVGGLALLYGVGSLLAKILAVSSPQSVVRLAEWTDQMQPEAILALPLAVHLLHGLVGSIVWMAGGFYLLKGRNWSRWLCLVWSAGVLLLTFLSVGPGVSFYLKSATWMLLCSLLLGGRSGAYFHRQNAADGT